MEVGADGKEYAIKDVFVKFGVSIQLS